MSRKNAQRHRTQDAAARVATIRQQTHDSFVNFGARVGLGANNMHSQSTYTDNRITANRRTLEAAYKTSWICGAVVDMPAEDMTRAGVEFTAGELSPGDGEKILKTIETLRIWDRICSAGKWARLYGGAVAIMLIDGQDNSTPLRIDTIALNQFKGLLVLDRWQVDPSVSDTITDFGPDLGYPKFYTVLPGARALANQRIHHSRVIRLDGIELPFEQQLVENGWGQSVLERLWDRLVSFDSTTMGTAQLVYKAHLRTMKVKDLRQVVAAGGKPLAGLTAQLDFMRQYQSNEGLSVLDADDEFDTHSYTFSGLDDVLMQMGQQLSGAAQIPLVRLFGQSPAGLNSTGESDLRTYYDGIKQGQETRLRTAFSRMFEVLSRSVLGRPLPPDFAFEFVSLWQMTPEQKSKVAKEKAEAVAAAFDSGIIDQVTAMKELRQASHETGVFTHISDEDIAEVEALPPLPGEGAPLGADLVPGDSLNPAVPGAATMAPDDSLNAAA